MQSMAKLRKLLTQPGIIRSLGAYDVFSARLMEKAGIELILAGGFGISGSLLGLPDVGFLSLGEIADVVRRMALRVDVPIVADGDTGHGDLHNVVRTVREFERAGAAGLLLEDQVAPKRCGHFQGKQVIPAQEMVLKLRAALDARRDPDFVILARTDARQVEGLNSAIERANRYAEAGADLCFVEAPQSREELARIPREVQRPVLANMVLGGVTPIVSVAELEQMGYKLMVYPIEGLLAAGAALQKLINTFQREGRLDGLVGELMPFGTIKQALGLQEVEALRDKLTRDGS
jgi:2,3-dimethylmalate lyase